MSKRIKIDGSLCVGCGICELACSFNKVGEFGRSRSAIRVFDNEENDIFPVIIGQFTDVECTAKVDVVIGKHELDWCTMCRKSCPAKAAFKELKNTAGIYCNMCGNPPDPQCVQWCPTGALMLVES